MRAPDSVAAPQPSSKPGPAPRILCWGELLWDLFPDGPQLGGASANVAVHAAQLGAEAWLVTRIGRDPLGVQALSALARQGVHPELVQIDEQYGTGTVNVTFEAGEPQFKIGSEAAWDQLRAEPAALSLLPSIDLVIYGSLAQRSPAAAEELTRLLDARPPSCRALCDLNFRRPLPTRELTALLLEQANLLKLNAAEARILAGLFGVADVPAWLLSHPRLELVALTHGRDGSELFTREQHLTQNAFPCVAPGDAVGAGDAFVAALSVALLGGADLPSALREASHYAMRVASVRGAWGCAEL